MNRRTFLSGVAGLLGSSSLYSRETVKPITLGLQSYTFRNFKLERSLQFMQKLGIQHAEFFKNHIPLNSSPDQLKAILSLCKEYQVKPAAFGVEKFTNDMENNRKLFEFARKLGIKVLTADPDPDSFDNLDKLCEEFKIAIAIHPHGPVGGNKMHRWYSAEIIMKAVKDHHPLIGSCLDTGHLIRSAQMGYKLDPAAEIRTMGARNFGIHLKDHDNQRKTDVICGKGVLDVKAVFQALREVDFKYMVSLEYEANPANPYDDVAACFEIMKQANQA